MKVPQEYRDYGCDDYYASPWSEQGYWDEEAQLDLIVPADEVEEMPEHSFLSVGRPGVDGIAFGYRKGHAGVWAFYPMEGTFVPAAATTEELVEKWRTDRLSL